MKNLDARAKAIIEAARNGDCPTHADRERIRRQVAVQIAAGAVAASSVAVAGTMSATAKVGLIVATVALVGGGSVGVVKVWHAHSAPAGALPHVVRKSADTRAVKTQPVATMPALTEPGAVAPATVPALVPQAASDSRQSRNERPRKRAYPTGADSEPRNSLDSLNAEVDLLARAREELRLGKPRRALDALAEYDRRFGVGALREERRAIAAIATCQAEPGPDSRAQAEAFIRSAPSSPLAERVRETCVTDRRPAHR
jgi:hypothetical protein